MNPAEEKELKLNREFVLSQLRGYVACAPEGAKVRSRLNPHRWECGRYLLLTGRYAEFQHEDIDVPDEFVEFFISSTRYKVRSEENLLRYIITQVKALPLECFRVSFL